MSNFSVSLENIRRDMDIAGVPGLAVSIIEDRQIKSTHAVGVKNAETQEPISGDTLFEAASLSKPVFTCGVLSLQQEGKFDLDRPLHQYLPLPESEDVPRLKQVTARQALTHTTGLQNWRFKSEDKLKFSFEPGTGFSYSGEGFFYVQRVVEQVTGQSIESFLQERVLRPFGMLNSTYIWRAELESLVSMGHHDRGKKAEPWNMQRGRQLLELAEQQKKPLSDWMYEDLVEAQAEIEPERPALPNGLIPNVAASLLTSAPEYAQFMLRLLDPNDKTTRQMLTSQHGLNDVLAWGLGIGLEKVNDDFCFWHWGDNNTFMNFMFGSPKTGEGIVVLTNESRGLKICERIIREWLGRDLHSFLWI